MSELYKEAGCHLPFVSSMHNRLFLLFCFDNLNETDVLKCTPSECLEETHIDPEKRFRKALAQLEYTMLKKYDRPISVFVTDTRLCISIHICISV